MPRVLSYFYEHLDPAVNYKFRVVAESRVGKSSYAEVSVRIADLQASRDARKYVIGKSNKGTLLNMGKIQKVQKSPKIQKIQNLNYRIYI